MKNMHKLKKLLCEELEEFGEKGKLSPSDIHAIYELASSVKNIGKVEMMEEDGEYSEMRGYSRDGEWMARGGYGSSYDDGTSGARRGMHYVRGHYSRDGDGGSYRGGSYDGGSSYEGGSSYRRGYSRAEGKSEMMRLIDEMMQGADSDRQREAIKRFRVELENS